MADQFDDYVPTDGESAETWDDTYQEWSENPEAYEQSEADQLRAEMGDLREQMQAAIAIDYGTVSAQSAHIQQQQAEAQAEQDWQGEVEALELRVGPLSEGQKIAMQHVGERSLNTSAEEDYAAIQNMSRQERWLLHHNAVNRTDEVYVENYVGGPDEWSDDPSERAQQRQAYIYAKQLEQQGYEDA